MILETLLAEAKGRGSSALEEYLEAVVAKKRADDIYVRSYLVRAHWRKRWYPKKRHLAVARRKAG